MRSTASPMVAAGVVAGGLLAVGHLGLDDAPGPLDLLNAVPMAVAFALGLANGPWLGLAGFFSIAFMLSLLIFIGEAVRDAFDPRKTFR